MLRSPHLVDDWGPMKTLRRGMRQTRQRADRGKRMEKAPQIECGKHVFRQQMGQGVVCRSVEKRGLQSIFQQAPSLERSTCSEFTHMMLFHGEGEESFPILLLLGLDLSSVSRPSMSPISLFSYS